MLRNMPPPQASPRTTGFHSTTSLSLPPSQHASPRLPSIYCACMTCAGLRGMDSLLDSFVCTNTYSSAISPPAHIHTGRVSRATRLQDQLVPHPACTRGCETVTAMWHRPKCRSVQMASPGHAGVARACWRRANCELSRSPPWRLAPFALAETDAYSAATEHQGSGADTYRLVHAPSTEAVPADPASRSFWAPWRARPRPRPLVPM